MGGAALLHLADFRRDAEFSDFDSSAPVYDNEQIWKHAVASAGCLVLIHASGRKNGPAAHSIRCLLRRKPELAVSRAKPGKVLPRRARHGRFS
jgi:hypothetical protein